MTKNDPKRASVSPNRADPETHLITEREAAARLGLKVSTLRRWRWAGKPNLPFHKIGSSVRYDPQAIQDFIEAGRRTSTTDTRQARDPR